MINECGWSSLFPIINLAQGLSCWKDRGVERKNGGELAEYHGEAQMAGWHPPDTECSKCVLVTVTQAPFNLQWGD